MLADEPANVSTEIFMMIVYGPSPPPLLRVRMYILARSDSPSPFLPREPHFRSHLWIPFSPFDGRSSIGSRL